MRAVRQRHEAFLKFQVFAAVALLSNTSCNEVKTPVIVPPASAIGALTGHVIDATTKLPLAAQVAVGDEASQEASADGAFEVTGPLGRTRLTVSLAGYVTKTREVGFTTLPTALPSVRLLAKAAGQAVSSAGGTVSAGDATLSFPAGAYASDVVVSATLFGQRQIGAAPGDVQFTEDGAINHRVLSVLHVEVETQPSVPVTVTMTVPPSATGVTVGLYTLNTSQHWDERIAPTSVAGGVASFQVPHFSDLALVVDAPMDDPSVGYIATNVDEGVTIGDVALLEGDIIPAATSTLTPAGGSVSIISPPGDQIDVAPGSNFEWLSAIDSRLLYGKLRAFVVKGLNWASPQPRYQVRIPAGICGVRGTAFDVAVQEECGAWQVDVIEGVVEVTADGTASDVSAGGSVSGSGTCDVDAGVTPPSCAAPGSNYNLAPSDCCPEDTFIADGAAGLGSCYRQPGASCERPSGDECITNSCDDGVCCLRSATTCNDSVPCCDGNVCGLTAFINNPEPGDRSCCQPLGASCDDRWCCADTFCRAANADGSGPVSCVACVEAATFDLATGFFTGEPCDVGSLDQCCPPAVCGLRETAEGGAYMCN